jgi:hypothetical protein
MERVCYRLCVAVLAVAVALGGVGPFFGATATAATSTHSHHQNAGPVDDLAMPMNTGAHHHDHTVILHQKGGWFPSSKHRPSHDHGCQTCCALCSATTVSAPVLPEVTLAMAWHEFFIPADRLIAFQVLLDPAIPKASV